MTTITDSGAAPAPAAAGLGILGLDHVEFYVANPQLAAHFYRSTFGLVPTGYAGLETGWRDRCSFIVRNGDVRFVVTGAIERESPIAAHLHLHGDGVKDIALAVVDVDVAFHEALRRGARPVEEPRTSADGDRTIRRASIAAFGDVVHSFVERDAGEWFLPGFERIADDRPPQARSVTAIDHLAVSLEPGRLAEQVAFYTNVLGFHESHEEYVTTDYTSMGSRVVESEDGRVRLPLLEPVLGSRRSQIEEYLHYHGGPGVQHAALLSDDILRTVANLRASGVDFLHTPATYYEMLLDRVGDLDEDLTTLRDLDILVDKDAWGYLMQIFSKPLQSRPTFFVEVIQRKGARGFGSGNIKALFEAVEREQMRRGTLARE